MQYRSCSLILSDELQPSRELAEQTYNQINKFKKYLESPNISVLLVVGGINIRDQIAALNAGVSSVNSI